MLERAGWRKALLAASLDDADAFSEATPGPTKTGHRDFTKEQWIRTCQPLRKTGEYRKPMRSLPAICARPVPVVLLAIVTMALVQLAAILIHFCV